MGVARVSERALVFSSGLCGVGEGGGGWGREKITRMGLEQDVGAGGRLTMLLSLRRRIHVI